MPKTYQHQKWGQRKPILFDRSQKGPAVTEPSAVNSCSFIQNFVHLQKSATQFQRLHKTLKSVYLYVGEDRPSPQKETNVLAAPDEAQVFCPAPGTILPQSLLLTAIFNWAVPFSSFKGLMWIPVPWRLSWVWASFRSGIKYTDLGLC